jgi:hypothetical protein
MTYYSGMKALLFKLAYIRGAVKALAEHEVSPEMFEEYVRKMLSHPRAPRMAPFPKSVAAPAMAPPPAMSMPGYAEAPPYIV